MSKRNIILSLTIGLVLLAQFILAAEDIAIQVRFFQGIWMEDQPGLRQVEILSTSSHSEISSLKAKAGGPESELKAAFIDALLDIMELRTVDDLFSFEKTWNGKDASLSEAVMQKPSAVFRFIFNPKRLSPQAVSLQTVIFLKEVEVSLQAGKDADKELMRELSRVLAHRKSEKLMDKILDKELVLDIGEPVVVGIPYKDRAYFMMLLLSRESRLSEKEALVEAKKPEKTYTIATPNPVNQVTPVYPRELRSQGVEGEIKLRVMADEGGIVQYIEVVKPLHPYLDYAAVQALRQWKFEPCLRKGKPVPVTFNLTFNFSPEIWRRMEERIESKEVSTGTAPSNREELLNILKQCAEYCQRLAESALDFICEEMIKEIHYNIRTEQIGEQKKLLYKIVEKREDESEIGVVRRNLRLWDPWRTEKNRFLCDYQLIKKGGLIKERRIVLKEDGRKMTGQKKLLEEKRFSVLMPLFASVRILERGRQPLFNYRILEEEEVQGKKAYVIEAVPKFRDIADVESAKIWVDKKSYQILKSEVEGVPLEGYENVLKESCLLNIKPEFKTTHIYQVEKNGVLFPSHSEVRVEYPGLGFMQSKAPKLKIDMTYDKFKFFTVETEQRIIK